MATYTYSISSDFGGNLNSSQFETEINDDVTIVKTLDRIDTTGDVVDIVFTASLEAAELTALNNLISAYVFAENSYVDITTAGSFGTSATISITPTSNLTLTLPDSSDTLTGLNSTQVLTNKTILSSANTITKTYDAIVNVDGTADYTSISAAFNAGKTSVYVRIGTYAETSDINIPNQGKLVGEANGQVVIYFVGAYSVKIDGSGGSKDTAGTIGVTNNSTTVTGSGTTFTNRSVGDYILIGNNFYEIATITSDTELALVSTYRGNTISGLSYMAQPMYTGAILENMIITNSSSYGVFIRGTRHTTLSSTAVTKCAPNVYITDSGDSSTETLITSESSTEGYILENCFDYVSNKINAFNNTNSGVVVKGISDVVVIQECSSACNGEHGFKFQDTTKQITISNCLAKQNASKGFYAESTTCFMVLQAVSCLKNGGDAIDFLGIRNLINCCIANDNGGFGIHPGGTSKLVQNYCGNNTSHGVYVNTDDCIVTGNTCESNGGDGINIDGNYGIVSDNRSKSNTSYGINIVTGSTKTIVTENNLLSNTTGAIVDSGTSTITDNNITT